MQKLFRIALLFAMLSALALTAHAAQAGPNSAGDPQPTAEAPDVPDLKLENWRSSTHQEKMAFLYGFVSMLTLEREWQGKKPLSIKQSLNASWVHGLDGVSIGAMCNAVDKYAAENPEKKDESVILVLGHLYVRDKMSPAERKAASARWEAIKAGK